jgi:adenine deaminase
MDQGHIDHLVRLAISEGLDPITALQMATINGAEWFRLRDRGAIAPGRRADMVVFSNLKRFRAECVISGGRVVARHGEPAGEWREPTAYSSDLVTTVHVDWDRVDFAIKAPDDGRRGVVVRTIGIVPDQIVTEHLASELRVVGGRVMPDVAKDVAKLAVIERHGRTGGIGLGFVRGLGLREGALASSVGHDAHNLTVAGSDDVSMYTAARAVEELGGGLVAAAGERVLASVPLPIGGLMSDLAVGIVRQQMDRAVAAAQSLGSSLHDPFMTLGFLALEVIPSLRLTDRGLVDVDAFEFVPLLSGPSPSQ